jgi:hypothetical protein
MKKVDLLKQLQLAGIQNDEEIFLVSGDSKDEIKYENNFAIVKEKHDNGLLVPANLFKEITGQDILKHFSSEINSPLNLKNNLNDIVEDSWDFWQHIVCNSDGTINIEQVKKELSDYLVFQGEVAEVYCHITDGKISKPNTTAEAVIGEFDSCNQDYVSARILEGINGFKEEIDYKEETGSTNDK